MCHKFQQIVTMRKLYTSLIDGPTQSAKTWKVFDVLTQDVHMYKQKDECVLVLFITQANNVLMTQQVITRASQENSVTTLFSHISDTSDYMHQITRPKKACPPYVFLVDFWHKKKMRAMLNVLAAQKWHHVCVIIDEADQGSVNGVEARLTFLHNINETLNRKASMHLFFVTATVPHLCKCIHAIAHEYNDILYPSHIIFQIIHDEAVRHYYVTPKDVYIGPSWFGMRNDGEQWHKLDIQPRQAKEGKDEYHARWKNTVFESIGALPVPQKRLCLVMISTITREHKIIAKSLLQKGFNVAVELNATRNRCYTVYFHDENDRNAIHTWTIPVSQIEKECKGSPQKLIDITLPEILQACLVMGTEYEDPYICQRMHAIHTPLHILEKLRFIYRFIASKRPHSYPQKPSIALIAGHIAGRGTTLQNPQIAFVCTSFCFMGRKDYTMRGAQNAQKFGRACGHLLEYHAHFGEKPVILTTENVMNDALSNELAIQDKSTGSLDSKVNLKNFVSEEDWKSIYKNHRAQIQNKSGFMVSRYQKVSENQGTNLVSQDVGEPVSAHAINKATHKMEYLLRIFQDAYPRALSLVDIKKKDLAFYEDFIEKQHRNPIHTLYHKMKKINRIGNKYVFVQE